MRQNELNRVSGVSAFITNFATKKQFFLFPVPKPCADHTCRMFCPHGFALAQDGCPLCRCRDPCDGIKCPNSLECHLEELACADPPCPPVPTCKYYPTATLEGTKMFK